MAQQQSWYQMTPNREVTDGFSAKQMQKFKRIAAEDESKAFLLILDELPQMSSEERQIVREELQDPAGMIAMIFRFFLQSQEYSFFIRRLKNVAITKISLRQLSCNEGIL